MEIIVDNIIYELDTKNQTAEVINYQGEPIDVIIPEFITYKFRKYKVTEIRKYAFSYCEKLKSITIPNSVTFIGYCAFSYCESLKSVTIPNSVTFIGDEVFHKIGLTLPKRYTEDGKLIAYKGFISNMTCRGFQYEEGKTFEIKGGKIKCCWRGFHACTNPLDIFNYYWGQIGKDIVIHEVYLSGDIEYNNYDSKVCSSKIEIGKRLTIKDINDIITTSSL